tara:strand:- start:190 stop:627 length:438 start_codon:yes stop_codon:yes gene_type:complete
MASQWNTGFLAIAHEEYRGVIQTLIDKSVWAGELDFSEGAPLSSDGGLTLTHRVCESLARSTRVGRVQFESFWADMLPELAVGFTEQISQAGQAFSATRWDPLGRVVAHLSVLWRRLPNGQTQVVATRDQVYAALGLTQYAEEIE